MPVRGVGESETATHRGLGGRRRESPYWPHRRDIHVRPETCSCCVRPGGLFIVSESARLTRRKGARLHTSLQSALLAFVVDSDEE